MHIHSISKKASASLRTLLGICNAEAHTLALDDSLELKMSVHLNLASLLSLCLFINQNL